MDLQKDFIDGTLTVPGAAGVLPFIDKVKKDYDLVYFTLDWHPAGHCSFKSEGGPWPAHCVHYTAGASLPDSVLEGLDGDRTRFILKGREAAREEYGAFCGPASEYGELFREGDEVVVCGIAAEYCVLETLKNIVRLSSEIGFGVGLYLDGTAKFDSYDTLLAYMETAGVRKV